MAGVGDGGLEGFDVEGAVRFEHAALDLVHALEALPVNDFDEFLLIEGLVFERLLVDSAIADEDGRAALEHAGEARRAEERADDEPVDREQSEGANDAAGYRVVVSDDGVLNRVGERKQDDEVKRV